MGGNIDIFKSCQRFPRPIASPPTSKSKLEKNVKTSTNATYNGLIQFIFVQVRLNNTARSLKEAIDIMLVTRK